jgi:hypothetical protein
VGRPSSAGSEPFVPTRFSGGCWFRVEQQIRRVERCGVEFKANVPTLVKDKDHIASARGSRFFHVGNDVAEESPNKAPQDAMDYRGHVLGWAKGVTTVEELVTRWARDRDLRMRCEVAHDDIQYLGTLIEPRLQKMRMAEGLSETQVAELWIKHGELVIPWKS